MTIKKITVYTDGSSSVFKDKKNMKYGGAGCYFPDNTEYNVS